MTIQSKVVFVQQWQLHYMRSTCSSRCRFLTQLNKHHLLSVWKWLQTTNDGVHCSELDSQHNNVHWLWFKWHKNVMPFSELLNHLIQANGQISWNRSLYMQVAGHMMKGYSGSQCLTDWFRADVWWKVKKRLTHNDMDRWHYTVDEKEKSMMKSRDWLRTVTLGERWHTNLLTQKMTCEWNE